MSREETIQKFYHRVDTDKQKQKEYDERWFKNDYDQLLKELDSMVIQFKTSTGALPNKISVSKEKMYLMHLECNAFNKWIGKPQTDFSEDMKFSYVGIIVELKKD